MEIGAKKKRQIRHPSWRVYKAVTECGLDLKDFGLKEGIDIFIPQKNNDDLTEELKNLLSDPGYKDDQYEIQDCLYLFSVTEDRQLIEAMLLNNKSLAEIIDVMGCSDTFALTYSSLFFDTSVFKNHVDKLVYVKEGTCGAEASAKKLALSKGDEFIKAQHSVGSDKLSMDSILADTFARAYMAMNSNADMDDVSSQEVAQGWGNLMLKVAQHLSKQGSGDGGLDQLVINLQTTPAPTKSMDHLD